MKLVYIGLRTIIFLVNIGFAFSVDEEIKLSELEESELEKGQVFVKKVDVPGWRMPAATLFKVIDASPIICAAIFSDSKRHTSYFPDLVSVTIDSVIDPATIIITHVQKTFLWFKGKSKVLNHSFFKNESYFIRWEILKSDDIKRGKGLITFQPFRGKTLMRYCLLVHPESPFASWKWIQEIAIGKLEELMVNTEKAVQNGRSNNPNILEEQIKELKLKLNIKSEE